MTKTFLGRFFLMTTTSFLWRKPFFNDKTSLIICFAVILETTLIIINDSLITHDRHWNEPTSNKINYNSDKCNKPAIIYYFLHFYLSFIPFLILDSKNFCVFKWILNLLSKAWSPVSPGLRHSSSNKAKIPGRFSIRLTIGLLLK